MPSALAALYGYKYAIFFFTNIPFFVCLFFNGLPFLETRQQVILLNVPLITYPPRSGLGTGGHNHGKGYKYTK